MLPVIVCVLAVAALLICEKRGIARAEWLFKPLAAAAFISAALAWGALDSRYGQWVLLGLTLCLAGDVCLIPRGQSAAFLAGMAAFLLGHLAYAIAFLGLPLNVVAMTLAAIVAVLFGAVVLRWLWPHLEPTFRVAVPAYELVILAMVSLAVAAFAAGAAWLLPLGAVAFAVSDIAVARNRFVAPGFDNRLWGLPLYFGSQLIIARTVALL